MPALLPTRVQCLTLARRYFFDVFDATKAPLVQEALSRIGAFYDIEAGTNIKPAQVRLAHALAIPLFRFRAIAKSWCRQADAYGTGRDNIRKEQVFVPVRDAELRRSRLICDFSTLCTPETYMDHSRRCGAEARMINHDITKTNQAVRELLDRTENPRHRFLLMAYDRHRNLEMAGRYEEIFAHDMMVEDPIYHLHANGLRVKLQGQESIKDLYRVWAATNQSAFYIESEEVAVSDHCINSVAVGYHQVTRRSLLENKILSYLPVFVSRFLLDRAFGRENFNDDKNSMYLYKSTLYMIWPYDDRGRLVGENIWEPEPKKAEIIKLSPADVLTTQEAGRLLAPLIRPLPSFEAMVPDQAPHSRDRVFTAELAF